MEEFAVLKEIYLYPVKSLGGIKLEKGLVTKFGLAHPTNPDVIDRKWMIIDDKGSFRTQRQLPRMALINLNVDGESLVFDAPGKSRIKVPINPKLDKKINCRVWNLHIDAYPYGGEIKKWINDFLQTEGLDLVIFKGDDSDPRKSIEINEAANLGRETDVVIFEDYSPFMLISVNSLEELNKKLENKVPMKQFRPNFVVDGCSGFSEDDWNNFKIGESRFCKIKHCTRCLLTTVDQEKGERDPEQQPLKTLKEFRMNEALYGKSPMFGINLGIDNPGLFVSIGDKIIKV
ncbi:unnamed protein product [Brachionus calyciflorus]|uniref:MOSC domain-containing protein n=1 Tax=Brachionus calyciflorus TaxID=104777 RepID=A0A813QEK4_9BILA|nr:unnamed protein product [Brachionus calyciflorus]